ncbi:GNAT family N-acetyltransferase [Nocardioides sp. ChNu-153]|uniref:GNAT family N-acetyltransferase n=1 Tax=unclassified Nocardioides TaxID=2615069 RepID=UPI002405370D|nr:MULTISPECIES: GNAT family N-acetyltransferase [unclassified Nocardioides]MDF9716893.1 GNAT family N-acetyltransferase [Nocardioides sp. ChNu-99]MDN7123163.1 GNAT family N-acetyltransferase [Nocardioides sp. ChNu-153]
MTRAAAVEVVALDPTAPTWADDVAAWHAVYDEVARHLRAATANPWSLDEIVVSLTAGASHTRRTAWVARAREGALPGAPQGTVVGAGLLDLPLLDNRDTASIAVWVPPRWRRQGVGTALAAAQEDAVRDLGRHVLQADAHTGDDAAAETALGGLPFARARGYEVALAGLQSRAALPVDPAVLDRLAGEVAPHHTAYALRTWEGPVRDDLVAGYARMDALVDVEAPSGSLEVEARTAAVDVWREREAESQRQGRRNVATAALDAGGQVVAITELWRSTGSVQLQQWSTIVDTAHRGHRLGLAVKIANLRRAQEVWPDATEVLTWNAADNGPMLAVNEQLGFRVVERDVELQRRLTDPSEQG